MSELVRMILDTYETLASKPGSVRSSGIVDQLLAGVRKWEEDKTTKDVPGRVVIDPEIDAKIRQLRIYEDNKDLCWMDLANVRALDRRLRDSFEEHINPLYWAGFYFQYSAFMERRSVVLREMSADMSVFILTDRGNHRLEIVGHATHARYSSMGVNAFKKTQAEWSEHVERAIARTDDGLQEREF